MDQECFDYVVIGSGFGGSVSAMRLAEKGYRVLVLERGKRFRDEDFPKSNWNLRRYLWMPTLRCFGIQEMSLLKDIFVLHGAGVGGGSLVYANVLIEPDDKLFEAADWRDLADWKRVLRPHFDTAKRMLGVVANPCLTPADHHLQQIAEELGYGQTFRPTPVGVFFNDAQPGELVPDPFFNGEGPERRGCIYCGGCMVGCRHNAKNTLVKNYLYFAEKWGAEIRPEAEAMIIRPLSGDQPDGARYEVVYRRSTALFPRPNRQVRARNVVISAHPMGTLRLLFRNRDLYRTLPKLSPRLGERVRTNSEALLGVTARGREADFSYGLAITSVVKADEITYLEPVRFPKGSSFMRNLGAPLIMESGGFLRRLFKMLLYAVRHPQDMLLARLLPHWAERSTILLVMQTADHTLRLKLGRSLLTLFRRGLVSENTDQQFLVDVEIAHRVTQRFAKRVDGVPQGTLYETLLGVPATAHFLGGCPMGRTAEEGVVDQYCRVHHYPGLYVVDGSIMPGNPGVNPSLTIAALAEYAMSHIPPKAQLDGALAALEQRENQIEQHE